MATETSPTASPKPADPPRQSPVNPESTGSPQSHRKQDASQSQIVLGMQNVTGIAQDMKSGHEARVTVPGAPGVDARLDNRSGKDRPPLEAFPAKPQQIDGPDVMGQVEHTRRTLEGREDTVARKGMFSPGQHGLAEESVRAGHYTPDAVDMDSSIKPGATS